MSQKPIIISVATAPATMEEIARPRRGLLELELIVMRWSLSVRTGSQVTCLGTHPANVSDLGFLGGDLLLLRHRQGSASVLGTVLGWVGQALATAVDVIAWAPRWMNVDSIMANTDQVSRVVVTFGAIAVSWLVVALAAFSTLRSLALKVALHTRALTRPLSLEQTETTVRAAVGLHLRLRIVASWFGSSGLPMDRDRDWRRLTVHSRKKQATAVALSLLLRVPYQIGRAVGTLWQFVTNRLILVIAVATWWYLYRPSEATWSRIPQMIITAVATFSPSAAAAWITVLTAVIAAFFISVRWRGKTAWRVSRYQHAHALLNDLSQASARTLWPLRDLIDTRAHDLEIALRHAVEELTHDRYYWGDDTRNLRAWQRNDTRSWYGRRLDKQPDEAAPVREKIGVLADLYRMNVTQGIQREIWMIAPRRARNALLEMQYQRAGIPWASELSVLDSDWLSSRVERFVENNRYLAEQFTDPDDDDDGPDQATLNRTSRAIREFAEPVKWSV